LALAQHYVAQEATVITGPAVESVDEVFRDFADSEMPIDVRRLPQKIAGTRRSAWHLSRVNGTTEAISNL
jgi:hypothetical protein